ncbi:hypothetical protein LguiA_021963 [Lonicera macranthoides]
MAPPTLSPHQLPLLIFSLLSLTTSSLALASTPATTPAPAPAPSSNPPSVYQILSEFGFPIGLLPDSVKSYTLCSNETFIVELHNPCYVHFEYLVYYETRISGKLAYGIISDIEGIQIQRYFMWFDIDEIKVVDLPSSESIFIQVGFISRELDVSQFQSVKSCHDKELASCGQSLGRSLALGAL